MSSMFFLITDYNKKKVLWVLNNKKLPYEIVVRLLGDLICTPGRVPRWPKVVLLKGYYKTTFSAKLFIMKNFQAWHF